MEPRAESCEGSGPSDRQEGETDAERAWRRFYRAASRGAVIGLLGRGCMHSAGAVLSTLRRRPVRSVAVVAGDTARWIAFLGAFAGCYVAVDEALRHVAGEKQCVPPPARAHSRARSPT